MFDAHCHLMDIQNFDINKCNELKGLINAAYDISTSKKALEMNRHSRAYAAVGISPQKCMYEDSLSQIASLYALMEENCNNVSAIGEVGLDFHWARDPMSRRNQVKCFKEMIKIAEQYEKPIIIHSRNSCEECIRLLEKFPFKVMFHFFSGTKDDAGQIVDRSWYISIPPVSSRARNAVIQSTEVQHLLSETDAPYVGRTPLDVAKSLNIISEIKQEDMKKIEKIIDKNCAKFIGI